MKTELLLGFAVLLSVGFAAAQDAEQVIGPPELSVDYSNMSCNKQAIQALHDASVATDGAQAELALLHADAYERLAKLGQAC
jgi:hypothetical protein